MKQSGSRRTQEGTNSKKHLHSDYESVHNNPMAKKHLLLAASVLAVISSMTPAWAGVVEKGTATKGVYWAEEKGAFGKMYYECFDAKTNKKVSKQQCIDAKAIKPTGNTK